MRIDEIVADADDADTDPALYELLMKLHKGATAGFNAKKTQQVLNLFPGWTIVPSVMIKPSDEARVLQNISVGEDSRSANGMPTWKTRLHATARFDPGTGKSVTRLEVRSYSKAEADAMQAQLAKYLVFALPDPKRAKPDDLFIMDMSEPVMHAKEDKTTIWLWSFDLYRKCKGYTITAPDGQSFDVCGPVQVLGFAGTKDFAAFFNWALAHTDLEETVNAKLGLTTHVPASERPRVPVGGQTIGTCAICSRAQVVRHGVMVNHGYQRPGHGYIIGECFGVGHPPYETSAAACVAYIPHLEAAKTRYERRLADLKSGRVTHFAETKRNWRTNRDEQIIVKLGEPRFDSVLKSETINTEQQIKYITADIATMHKRSTDWKPGTLRRNDGY